MPRRDPDAPRVEGTRVLLSRTGRHQAPAEWTDIQSLYSLPTEIAYQIQIAWVHQFFSRLSLDHNANCDVGSEDGEGNDSGCRGTFKLVVGGRAGTALPWEWRGGGVRLLGWSRQGLPREQNVNPLMLPVFEKDDIDNRLAWINQFISKPPVGWIEVVKISCLNVPLLRRYVEDTSREADTLQTVSSVSEYLRVEWLQDRVREAVSEEKKRPRQKYPPSLVLLCTCPAQPHITPQVTGGARRGWGGDWRQVAFHGEEARVPKVIPYPAQPLYHAAGHVFVPLGFKLNTFCGVAGSYENLKSSRSSRFRSSFHSLRNSHR